jgi:hypothetical protein
LTGDAQKTLEEHKARWDKFREEGGEVLEKYFDNSFHYLQTALKPGTTVTSWVQGGLSLLIGYCSAGRQLYQAAYKLYPPQD